MLIPMAAQRCFFHEDEVQMKKTEPQGSALDQRLPLVSFENRVLCLKRSTCRYTMTGGRVGCTSFGVEIDQRLPHARVDRIVPGRQ